MPEGDVYETYVAALSRSRRLALLENGNVVPVTQWLDDDGNPVPLRVATLFICGADGLGHSWIFLEDLEMPSHAEAA